MKKATNLDTAREDPVAERGQDLSRIIGLIAVLVVSIGVAIFISPIAAVAVWILASMVSGLARQRHRTKRAGAHAAVGGDDLNAPGQ